MSDHNKAGACPGVFRGSGIRRPQDPHQLQRMGHWKHISAISAPSIHRDNADVHKEECDSRGQSPLTPFWKSKEASLGHGQMSDQGTSLVMSDPLHPAEGTIAGKGASKGSLRKENARAFEIERMILSKTSVCRMESSFVDWKKVDPPPFLHSGIVSSEWQRYAGFNVNRKTQSVVQSKRKYGCWDARLEGDRLQTTQSVFASAPEGVKSVPEEYPLQGEYTVQRSRLYRLFQKERLHSSGPLQGDHMGSGCKLGEFSQMPEMGPSIFTREENIHSISGIACKEKMANHSCLNLEKEICEACDYSLLTFSGRKMDKRPIMECSGLMPRVQSPEASGDSPMDVSDNELLFIKRSSMQGFVDLNEPFSEQHFQQSGPGFSMHEVGALGRSTTIDSVSRSLGISVNDVKGSGQSVNGYSTDEQNESHVKTPSLDMDVHRVKSLPEGATSSRSDKKDFTGMQNLTKSEAPSSLQMEDPRVSNHETELLDTSLDFSPCIGTADIVDPNGLRTSKTDTVEVEHIFSHVQNPEKSGSSLQLENHLSTEVSSRWVKRLKVNSDSVAIGTRDDNMEDVLPTGRVHKLFSRVMNYSRSNSFTMAKCLQERQQFQKTMLLLRNNDSPVESLKESHPWIQRWCQKSQQTARRKTKKPIEVPCELEKTTALPENLGANLFPSLAAMALMGKAINNFRPCEVRRRGSSLVWHTERF